MLSIIIVNFKNPPLLRLCLKTLTSALTSSIDYEIIVVDVASTVETRNVTREFERVKLLPYPGNIGFTKGANEGIKAALGEYLFIMNPDVIILKGSLEKMVNYLAEHTEIGLLGPRLLNFDGTPQPSVFRFYSPLIMFYRRTFLGRLPWGRRALAKFTYADRDITEPTTVDWIMGGAVMTSQQAVQKTGLMDEQLFLYFNDVDWAWSFWENDLSVVYFPAATMYHYHRRGSKGSIPILDILFRKETRWHINDAFRYFRKRGLFQPRFPKKLLALASSLG